MKAKAKKFLFSILVGIVCPLAAVNAQGTWTQVTTLSPHPNMGVMLLMSDGTAICHSTAGGSLGDGSVFDVLKPNATGSYIGGTWTSLPAMISERFSFSSAILKDGRVYCAGGEYGTDGTQNGYHGEVYSPTANTWTAISGVSTAYVFSDGNCKILENGNVLQAGYANGSTGIKVFNPSTMAYTTGASTLANNNESMWLKLPDNSILYVNTNSTTSERYIPATNTWIADGNLPVSLYDTFGWECGPGFMLPDGRAFFLGGTGKTAYYTPSGTTAPGTWAAGPVMPNGYGMPDAPAVMLPNGKILLACSPAPTASVEFASPTYFYLFDYTTNAYTAVTAPGGGASLNVAAYQNCFLLLPDGSVLEGINQAGSTSSKYYIFTPTGTPVASGKPTIANVTPLTCTTFRITGTKFNGISEGSAYGDENENDTNYPIIRLKSGSNVYYCRSYNWNSTGIMRGNLPDTAFFATPAGLANGSYYLSVIANGIASDSIPFTMGSSANAGTVSGTSPLCASTTAQYTSSGDVGGTWSSSSTAIATVNSSSGVVTGVTAGTTNIIYSVSTCGSPASAFKTLTVTANGNAGVVSGTTPLCIGATSTYTTTGSGGSWSSSSTAVATVNSSTGVVTAVTAGTTNIIYTVSTGCSPVTAFKTLTVSPNANAGTVSGTSPLCIGVTSTYTTTGSGGAWSSSSSAVATVNSSTGVVTPVSAGTTNIIYTVSSGCGSPVSAFKTLTVSPNVSAGTVSGTSPLCIGVTSTYTTTGTGGAWSSSNTTVATVNSSTGIVTPVIAGTVNIIYTVSSGCGSPVSAFKTLTVSPNANAGVVSGTTPLCIGVTATYSSSGDAGGTWSSSSTVVATVNSATGVVTTATAGTTNIIYTVSSGCGSPVSALKTLTVSPNANAGTVSGTTPLCTGVTSTYSTTGTGGTWSSSNTAVATVNSSTGIVTPTTAGTVNIIYTVSSGCGSPVSAFKTLTVNPNASAGTVSGTSPLCIGVTSTYTTTGTGGAWSSSNTAVATVNSSTGIVTPVTGGTVNIIYTVSSGCGSPVSAFKTLTVSPNVSAGTVSGTSPLCIGVTSNYTTTGTGGAWSSSSPAVATVNSSTGVVTTITAGTLNIVYTVSNGCGSPVSASKNLTVNNCGSATLNLTVFIQGYYRNMGSATPMDNLGIGGCLFINGISANPLDVDSMKVTLMDPTTHNAVENKTGILKTNGSLSLGFSGSRIGNSYYLKLNHRNSFATWSAAPVLINSVTNYDFTTSSAQTYGNSVILIDGKWAIYNGDIDQNGVIDVSDYSVIDFDSYYQHGGYIASDLTGDGIVDSSDYSVIDYNAYYGIGSAAPW